MNQPDNPYSPPESDILTDEAPIPMVYASRGRRFGTYVIDYICFVLSGMVVGLFIGLVLGDAGIQALEQIPDLALGLGILIGYYAFFEGLWQRTPGKWVFGTKVVNEHGLKPTFGQILGRSFCRLIPFEAFSFFSENAIGWHDSIPKTRVVMVRI
ncbi:RDD family protein [Ahniella affigens]|nr:RDD family protein [Ahniella affigens]